MYEGFTFPNDADFIRVSRKIEDAVTVAINSGITIGDPNERLDCRCPLGCFNLKNNVTHPDPRYVTLPVARFPALAFGRGFDGHELDCDEALDGDMSAYYRLGLAYRRRFVEGKR